MSINVNLESNKNSKFSLKFENSNNKLYVWATNLTTIPIKNYKKELALEQIQENKYFCFCDNISEVINELTEIKSTKIEEENNCITLFIPINSKKIKEFIIKIEETPKSSEEKTEELYRFINQLLIENKNLKSKVETLENKFSQEIKELKESNENLKNQISSLFVDSNIITSNQYQILKNWINPNRRMKFKLLYSAKRDGDNRKAFHDRCDNKAPTITIVQTQKDVIFGGYTEAQWDSGSNSKKDQNAFCFSLTNNKKYLQNEGNNSSIYCNKDYGPWFGTCFIGIGYEKDNFCSDSSANYLNDLGHYGGKDYKKYEINNNEKSFVCKEVEVFEVKYL